MQNKPTLKPLRIGLLLYPGCMPSGLFGVADLLRAANLRMGQAVMEAVWVGVDAQAVSNWQGPSLTPQLTLAQAALDVCVVPGLWLSSPQQLPGMLLEQGATVRALRDLPRQTVVWSYCAGVALVAASGRLDGIEATATWWLRQALQTHFARVNWRFDEPLVQAKTSLTACGPSGYLNIMLHTLSKRLGPQALSDLQETLLLPQPRAKHAAFFAVDLLTLHDPVMRRLAAFAQRTPAAELSLVLAAQHLATSSRSLSRSVEVCTGMSAGQWLKRVKLHQVAQALESSNLPLKRISANLGFSSEMGLHRSFKQAVGCTPAQYRVSVSSH